MSSGLILILIVTGAYLAAHFAFERLAHRFLIVSGAEYLLLGILIGPQVSGLISTSVVGEFAPLMTLALGWMGAVIGAEFHLPSLVRTPGVVFRIAFAEAILAFGVVTGIMAVAFAWIFDLPFFSVILPAATLGAVATTSASSGVRLVAQRLVKRGPVVRQLEVTTVVDALVAIVVFGLLLCFAHPAPLAVDTAPTATEWAVITFAVGVVGGALFHLFLQGEESQDRLFISLAGAIILASGAAAYLRLSPMLPTLIIGAILVNTSRSREQIREVLHNVERPLYFLLLTFAGAAWSPSAEPRWWIGVLLFVLTRYVSKLGSARLAARATGALPTMGPNWGRALLAPGPVAIAIALNYLLIAGSVLPHIVFTCALTSLLLTDVLSARLVQSVLRDYMKRVSPRMRIGAEET